jgi:hypothetical protein
MMTAEIKQKISVSRTGKGLGHPFYGLRVHTPEMRRKNAESHRAAAAYNWIEDRTQLAKQQERNDAAYKEWRRQVWLRDDFKCRIADSNCEGRIEAHHILPWSAFPELRYQITNGITLCRHHHPRRRADVMEMAPLFQGLATEAPHFVRAA